MSNPTSVMTGRKWAIFAALLSVPFAVLTQTLFGIAHHGDINIFLSGETALNLSDGKAAALYYGYWADVLGYYIIFLPVIVFAWRSFRKTYGFMADLAFLCGVIFCVMGAMGAVTQAEAYMSARQVFNSGADGARGAAIAVWEATIAGQWRGVWMVETLLGAVWFGSMAKIFRAEGLGRFGLFTLFIALIWFVQILTWLIPAGREISDIALSLNALLVPVWALCLAINLIRSKI